MGYRKAHPGFRECFAILGMSQRYRSTGFTGETLEKPHLLSLKKCHRHSREPCWLYVVLVSLGTNARDRGARTLCTGIAAVANTKNNTKFSPQRCEASKVAPSESDEVHPFCPPMIFRQSTPVQKSQVERLCLLGAPPTLRPSAH
jgi:hypothetical protein